MLLIDWICNTVNWGIAVSEIALARVTINVLINHKLIYILKCIHWLRAEPKRTEQHANRWAQRISIVSGSFTSSDCASDGYFGFALLNALWYKLKRLSKQIRLCLRSGVIGDEFIFFKSDAYPASALYSVIHCSFRFPRMNCSQPTPLQSKSHNKNLTKCIPAKNSLSLQKTFFNCPPCSCHARPCNDTPATRDRVSGMLCIVFVFKFFFLIYK